MGNGSGTAGATVTVVAVVVGVVVTDGSVQPRQVSGQLIKTSVRSHVSRLNDGLEQSSDSGVDPQVSSTAAVEQGSTVVAVVAVALLGVVSTLSPPEPSSMVRSVVSGRLDTVDVGRAVPGSTVALGSVVAGDSWLGTTSSLVGCRFGV